MGNRKIILITGGQRSGKSAFSEKLALELSENPIYLATAHVMDDEFKERVRLHQERRGPQWGIIEEETELSRHDMSGKTVLVDCVTMWLTNVFFSNGENVELTLEIMKKDFLKFTRKNANFIFVSNEIGMGVIGATPLERKFADAQGWINQFIARHASDVYLTISGIPVKIK